jgi:hypothetical protein
MTDRLMETSKAEKPGLGISKLRSKWQMTRLSAPGDWKHLEAADTIVNHVTKTVVSALIEHAVHVSGSEIPLTLPISPSRTKT